MKLNIPLITLLILSSSGAAFGQQAMLRGRIVYGDGSPASGVRVIAPGGEAVSTDSGGHFTISFPDSIKPGQAVRIQVTNWKVFDPMFGECWSQLKGRSYELLKITVISSGSVAAHIKRERLGAIVDEYQRRVNRQAKTIEGQSRAIDKLERDSEKYSFLKDYEKEYGIAVEKLKSALDEWAQIKESDDKLEQARKEYWLGNYEKVTALTMEAGPPLLEKLKKANKQRLEDSRKIISNYTLEGNAFFWQSKLRESLKSFKIIEKLFETRELSKEDLTAEWGELKLWLGGRKHMLGIIVKGEEGKLLLSESIKEYEQALTVYTRETFPQQWAMTKSNLGSAFGSQGLQLGGKEGKRLLAEAVEAHRESLTVYSRETSPREWAMTQDKLGRALSSQAKQFDGEEVMQLLEQAVKAFREAQEVRKTHKPGPQ